MAYEQLCMYCFEDRGGENICPHCGRDSRAAVPQIQMLPGSLVYHERFLVGRALGQDATGIVYAAFDTKRENKLRLREYLPRDCAERLPDGSVVPIAGMEDAFEKGLKKLRASVEGVEDPRKRHFFFEENGTAYIAQRKNAAGGSDHRDDGDDDDERDGSLKRVGIIVGVCAVLVIAAAVVIISLVNGALNTSSDVTQNPTLNPGSTASWAPDATPSPTPYVSPTFAALVDPEQSWMDYTYSGDVNQEFEQQQGNAATATPKPTIRPEAEQTGYKTISSNSSSKEITGLQQRLVTLGWLSYNNITGSYDSATRQAVKDFQTYVNETIKPSEKLSVDGIAGPKTLQWLYGTDSSKPTPKPTAAVTPNPDQGETVDKNSSKTDIRAVQRKLIALGLMKSGADDGVYGTTTTAAVKKFQQRVNQLQGFDVLDVTGTVDPLTMAFLNYYVEQWEQIQQATATPQVTVTPTPRPTDIPDQEETGQTVDQDSAKESIQFVQQMLISAGLMREGSDDGVYGSATVAAVARFQEWVNQQTGKNTLSVTGTADPLTLAYLEEVYSSGMVVVPTASPTSAPTATPSAAPTAAPTNAPTATPVPTVAPTDIPDEPEDNFAVDKDSPKESIQYVQQMLAQVGLLGADQADGVYGSATEDAVRAFQQAVNAQLGEGTLDVTGMCDTLTLSYLEEYASSGTQVAPTAQPTQAPAGELTLNVNGAPAGGGIIEVTGDSITFDWSAQGNVAAYSIYVTRSDGSSFYKLEGTNITYGGFPKNQLEPGEVYTISVGALPEGGSADDIVWASAQFTVPVEATGAPTATPAPESVEVQVAVNGSTSPDGVLEISGSKVTFDWASSGNVESYTVRVTGESGNNLVEMSDVQITHGELPVSSLTPGEVYTLSVGAKPAGGGETVWSEARFMLAAEATASPSPEPTESVPEVQAPSLTINGSAASGVVEITGERVQFEWSAEGDVESYSVYVEDSEGNRFLNQTDYSGTVGTLEVNRLTPGQTYTIGVGARPRGGSEEDIVWATAQFTVPVQATATPEPEPTPSSVTSPQINIDGTAYSQDGVPYLTGNTAIFSWMSTGELQGYQVYMTNSAGQKVDLGNTTETSKTIRLTDLAPDVYQIYVGAVPVGARNEGDIVWNSMTFGIPASDPTPTPQPSATQNPSADFPTSLDKNSASADIQKVQQRLYQLGLLSTEDLQPGVLDVPTLRAIASFQQYMNETYDMGLSVIDPENPDSVIDAKTLAQIAAGMEPAA